MLQDSSIANTKHSRFVAQVVELDTVWGLKTKEGWLVTASNDHQDVKIFLFWSEMSSAAECAKDDWVYYVPESMPLAKFLEDWCVGMHYDNVFVGTNWDSAMPGKEIEPLKLALEILEKVKEWNKQMEFTKYGSADDFESQIREAISKIEEP